MRKFAISAGMLLASLAFPLSSNAGIQIDPTLTAAIYAQTQILKDQYETRSNHHKKIETAQAAITLAMDNVHKVEEKMLEYMANASGALKNLQQLKTITELVVTEIPKNLSNLSKDIPSNIKGTAITMFVNKTIAETTTDIVALSDIVARLVTSNYSFKNSNDSQNINLLSAAERFTILQDVLRRLESINHRIFLSDFYIKTFGWKELWKGLDRESWRNMMYGRVIANQLINRWNNFKK